MMVGDAGTVNRGVGLSMIWRELARTWTRGGVASVFPHQFFLTSFPHQFFLPVFSCRFFLLTNATRLRGDHALAMSSGLAVAALLQLRHENARHEKKPGPESPA